MQRVKIPLEEGTVEKLREAVQDLADFPDTVFGYFVFYHTIDDRVRALYKATNASELIGDISRVLFELQDAANDCGGADAGEDDEE
jgi:hypothetical protein